MASVDDATQCMDNFGGQNLQNIHVLQIVAHNLIHTSPTEALFYATFACECFGFKYTGPAACQFLIFLDHLLGFFCCAVA